MTLLYILIGLAAVYLAYTFGTKKGYNQPVQPFTDKKNADNHGHAHAHTGNKSHGGGCC